MGMPAEKFGRIHRLRAAQLAAVIIDGRRDRGLIGDDGWLSEQGRAVKQRVEALTDDLAANPTKASSRARSTSSWPRSSRSPRCSSPLSPALTAASSRSSEPTSRRSPCRSGTGTTPGLAWIITGADSLRARLLHTASASAFARRPRSRPSTHTSASRGPIVDVALSELEADRQPLAHRYFGPELGDAHVADTDEEGGLEFSMRPDSLVRRTLAALLSATRQTTITASGIGGTDQRRVDDIDQVSAPAPVTAATASSARYPWIHPIRSGR